MSLFGGVINVSGISFLMFSIMVIVALGYLLGRITIKGVSLGTAGVFIVALLFGALFYEDLSTALKSAEVTSNGLKIVENTGLVFFVTSVGFIAGPKFFKNLKKNFKSYILLGVSIILAGGLTCVACYYIGRGSESNSSEFIAMLDGLLSGSLTTTPGFSAAKETVKNLYVNDPEMSAACEAAVTVGHGIAYLFGVVGVVLFVQLIPKFTKANMEEERKKLASVDMGTAKTYSGKLIDIDPMGLGAFGLAALIGLVIGNIRIPLSSQGLSGTCFSLTTTGGALVTALVFGHFSRIGRVNIMPPKKTLENLRELGLMLFLIGAGVAGGANFVKYFKPVYFLYGAIMTLVPMIVGYLIAKYILKLSLLNNLGSITGGMTSTPALGTLINVAGTEDVAAAYAATYPIALLAVVLVSQFLIVIFG
ncbi:permease [Yeguia hominis]|uniref:Permease n=1 Tax=Yeguia hominis TaxID=2763662 RepID=A0A926DBI4_9FIRM|nr:permease [Yeguia hominis]MBC8533940.1 permease [Yeguia hominis]